MKSNPTIYKLIAVAVAGIAAFGAAQATPANITQWSLSGVTFQDGSTASGTFSMDSDTADLILFDITTTNGSFFNGFHYTPSNSMYGKNSQGPNSIYLFYPSTYRFLSFSFEKPLTAAVSKVDINIGPSFECRGCGSLKYVIAGQAVSMAAIPEPETYTMLLAGLGVLGLVASRRKSS